ncbi:competence protein ComK [Sutcliffiella halmapala]|uniref:competence protein ComK n=1 Tax=Sutcliffiella halmapala TaxID=79882 RepID=UPI000994BC4C|nr:competence protein ComK [Sutcliffiella halmapala]
MNDVNFVTEYEINRYTMAILSVEKGGKLYSKVLEVEGELFVDLTPLMIVENSCSYYGSNYEGRKQGSRMVAGLTHKPPIAIDPMSDLYFFPTSSPKNDECNWISLHHVLESHPTTISNTYVKFMNKEEVELPLSPQSFEKQMQRASFLRTRLYQRVNGHVIGLEHRDSRIAPPGASYRSKNDK